MTATAQQGQGDVVARLREAAREIRNDGTASQVGLSDQECEEIADEITRLRTLLSSSGGEQGGFTPIEHARKDGTPYLLLVEAIEDDASEPGTALEDVGIGEAHITIGFNNFDHDGEDEWKRAGWDWNNDYFTEGRGGRVIGFKKITTSRALVAPGSVPASLTGQVPDDWTLVPNIGAYVEADHPITCINPMKAFEVRYVECRSGSWYVRGEETCWFNVKGVKPATPENALAAEQAAALQSSPQPTAGETQKNG